MDMRSKAYPALPEDREMRLVLPRVGDLTFRSQLPHDFKQRLYIHADPRRRFWYSRFELRRKFIVMSTQGDLFTKSIVYNFTIDDLVKKNVLNMPRVARGDLIKALDLVQCVRSEGQRWELVFARWRTGMETWLPLEVVQLLAPDLLQEFYVNTINSWAFHARLQQGSLSVYRTEVELWLFHSEFQQFYNRLHQMQAVHRTASQPRQQAALLPDRLPVKSEHLTALPVIQPAPAMHPPASVGSSNGDSSETVIQEFEQRRLARERQVLLEQSRRHLMLQQLQQRMLNQAEEQRRLQVHEHEQNRQRAHEELQRKQKEYHQRLRAQQERERLTALQHQEQLRQQRQYEQDQVRVRLQQEENQRKELAAIRASVRERPHKTTSRTYLRPNGRRNVNHSSLHRPKERQFNSRRVNDSDDEYVPLETSESGESDGSANSDAREESLNSPIIRKRRRKRLLYSQVEVDEDDDDLPDLSKPPPPTCQRPLLQDKSRDDSPTRKVRTKRRRLRRYESNDGESNSHAIDLTQQLDDNDDERCLESAATTPGKSAKDDSNQFRNGEVALEHDDDDDVANSVDDVAIEPLVLSGTIRCVCGVTSVGGYRGQWLQCGKEDCGAWEHADCVGFLSNFEPNLPQKYVCSRCDSSVYLGRREKALDRLLDWMFQCCNSRNPVHLMNLLESSSGAAKSSFSWKNANYEDRTLAMHAARNGLARCLCYLLDECKVDLFETDAQSRNLLHHAALGESIVCCRALLKRDRKLLFHQDLRGRMPYHLMLLSARLNCLCIPYMRLDTALVGMGDLDSNFPIHYACQAINAFTIEICRMILAAQPIMLDEKSSEGLYPLMILCKAAGISETQNRVVNVSAVFKHAKEIIALMLDVDVFGDCLNQRAPNGWMPLHFAAASGNHELITYLCNLGLSDVQYAAPPSGQTALHIAAQNDHPLCVRALLLEGLNVVSKDNNGWIPMLHANEASCLREFMHYKLTKQLSRLHRMLGKVQQRGIVQRWQHRVARDLTCFDILNDWCRKDTERIERMEGLLLSNPFLLRLDNKIHYVSKTISQSVKKSPGKCASAFKNGSVDAQEPPRQKKIVFAFSRESGCFWKQFVGMGVRLEPEDFRLPIIFSIEQGSANSLDVESREGSFELVLNQLAKGLRREAPGLLLRASGDEVIKRPLFSNKDQLAAQLLTFFMLGELVAHLVLFRVPLSGILDFNFAFLRCVGRKERFRLTHDKLWEYAGRSFAAGFDGVLPATLEIFHANELSVLFNVSKMNLNAVQIDWDVAVDWDSSSCEQEDGMDADSVKAWLPRLIRELVTEEQQLVLLFLTGSFDLINERFFRSEGVAGRITVECLSKADNVLDHDVMYPTMEHNPDVLRIPPYSCYEAFKKGFLTVIRHTDQAFLPE